MLLAPRERQLSRTLNQALATLSPNDREILWLRTYQELPYREIAEVLEIEEPAARARMHVALGRLKQTFRRDSTGGADFSGFSLTFLDPDR